MPLLLLAIFGGLVGVFVAYKSGSSVIDNALIDTGVADNNIDVSSSDEAVAVKNNNPLNIRESNDSWVGLAEPRAVKGFCNFVAPEYGYRAAKRIILGAYASRGANTISAIINAWAPPSENSTTSYIKFVCDKSGLTPATVINTNNLAKLFYAMTIIESGKAQPMSVIERGLAL